MLVQHPKISLIESGVLAPRVFDFKNRFASFLADLPGLQDMARQGSRKKWVSDV